jgi:hypothetical protein
MQMEAVLGFFKRQHTMRTVFEISGAWWKEFRARFLYFSWHLKAQLEVFPTAGGHLLAALAPPNHPHRRRAENLLSK